MACMDLTRIERNCHAIILTCYFIWVYGLEHLPLFYLLLFAHLVGDVVRNSLNWVYLRRHLLCVPRHDSHLRLAVCNPTGLQPRLARLTSCDFVILSHRKIFSDQLTCPLNQRGQICHFSPNSLTMASVKAAAGGKRKSFSASTGDGWTGVKKSKVGDDRGPKKWDGPKQKNGFRGDHKGKGAAVEPAGKTFEKGEFNYTVGPAASVDTP